MPKGLGLLDDLGPDASRRSRPGVWAGLVAGMSWGLLDDLGPYLGGLGLRLG